MKLTIELVPQSSFYKNVRSEVSKEKWDIIRRECYKKAGYKCEICNGKGDKWPVECHEIWEYDDDKNVQRLAGFIALCPLCHKVKHIGLAQLNGELDIAKQQLMKVNSITEQEANNFIESAFNLWQERSLESWELDLSFLQEVK